MKYQILFSQKNNKNPFNVLSAELAKRVVHVKVKLESWSILGIM